MPAFKESLKEAWIELAIELADKHYPKGEEGNRRDQFLRDQALMIAHFRPVLIDLMNSEIIGKDELEQTESDTAWYNNRLRKQQRAVIKW